MKKRLFFNVRPRMVGLMVGLMLGASLLQQTSHAQGGLTLSEAVKLALARSPDIQLQHTQERISEGVALIAGAPFDSVSTASLGRQRDLRPLRADERQKYLYVGPDQQINLDSLQLGASRLLESGVQVSGAYSLGRSLDSLQSAVSVPQQNIDRLTFTLRLPMQRNAGRDARASRDASELEASAVRRDTEQSVARTILAVAQTYWDWSARQATAAVALSAELRMLQLKRETEKLIALDELPPAELNLLQAAVTERVAARIGAQQRERDAQFALGRLYGMNAEETAALGSAADAPPDDVQQASRLEVLRRSAIERRADLAALQLREQAMRARLESARENNKPVVDLELSGYYAGLRESTRSIAATPVAGVDLVQRITGPGVSARVSMQWPFENSANLGGLRIAIANAEAARLRRLTLEQSIFGNVDAAFQSYTTLIGQLRASNETVQRYRAALKDIQTKRLLGSATLIDVLNVEDRLNGALQTRLQYQQGYAAARAQILFETGALVTANGNIFSVDMEQLLP